MSYYPAWVYEYLRWRKALSYFQTIDMGSVTFASFSNMKWEYFQKSVRADLLGSTPLANVLKANNDAGLFYMRGVLGLDEPSVSVCARPVSSSQPLLK